MGVWGMRLLWALALFFAPPGMAVASDASQRFGAREAVQQISLSPDGKKVAFIQATEGRGSALFVGGADIELKPILSSSGNPERLTHCRWSTNTRLVCGIYFIIDNVGIITGFTRMITLNADGSDLKQLSARESSRALGRMYDGGGVIDWLGEADGGSVLMTRDFVPESTTGSILGGQRSGLGVERVNTSTLKRSRIEAPANGIVEYISDGHGTIRVKGMQPSTNTGYLGNRIIYDYRRANDRDWQPLSTVTLSGNGLSTGFEPYAVDRDLDVVYGFDSANGRKALYKIALDGTMKREMVIARPDVDIDNVVSIGRRGRIVGVSYATDRRQVEFFDPQLKALGASLSKALPNLPLISFVDASADESVLLLFAGSDVDPGRFYLYDKASRKLSEILPVRPQLAKTALTKMKPISFRAADGTQIPAYLTLPAGSSDKKLPAIVMPHGGPGARDEWGFDWLAQFYAARGYAVLQPNFRGSAGYGEAWFQKNGFQSWRTAIGDINDGGRWLQSEGIAAAGKIAIVGWSYGGYAALQSAVLDPDLFKAIVAIAPVTDLESLRHASRHYTNFKLVDAYIGLGPHVRQGSPAQNIARVKAPVLLFHGDIDGNVPVGQSRTMASRLKDAGKAVEYVEYRGLDHALEDNVARNEILDKSDAFLRAALGL